MKLKYLLIIFLIVDQAFIISKYQSAIYSQTCNSSVGTINNMSSFIGRSVRNKLNDTIFLCWKDRFQIDHNDNFDLSGDPDPTTIPGVGYGWYKQKPTVSGNTKAAIYADPGQIWRLTGDPDMMITVDHINGDAEFANDNFSGFKSLNQFVNGGNPTLINYAPITYDKRKSSRGYHENGGPCVKAAPDEAFTVVYLNPITISDIQYNVGGNPLKVSFVINGGAPEYYQKRFPSKKVYYENINIKNAYSSSTFSIPGTGYSNGDSIQVVLNDYDKYEVTISDKYSCSNTETLITSQSTVPSFIMDTISGKIGDTVCLTMSITNFKNISYATGRIDYDPSVIQFNDVRPIFPDSADLSNSISVFAPGILIYTYEDVDAYTIGNDTTQLMWLCFKIIGNVGDCSPVLMSYFSNVTTDGADVYPYLDNGLICIDPPDGLYVSSRYCGASNNGANAVLYFKTYNGTPPYTYTIKDGATIIESGTVLDENVETAVYGLYSNNKNYTIEIIDFNGNTYTTNKLLSPIEPILIDKIGIKNPKCYGGDDGELVVQVDNIAYPNVKYAWSNNVYNDTISSLSSGVYTVTITDLTNGCSIDTSLYLFTPDMNVQLTLLDSANCLGVNNGRAQAIASGGTPGPGGVYTFQWQQGNFPYSETAANSIFKNLNSGGVTLKVKDANNCKKDLQITVPYKYTMDYVDTLVQDPTCFGSNNGKVTIVPKLLNFNGSADYYINFQWQFPTYQKIGKDKFEINNLGESKFVTIITENSTGCSIRDTFSTTEPQKIGLFYSNLINTSCSGIDGSVNINFTGGKFPITFSGENLPTKILNSGNQLSFTDLEIGDYKLNAIDLNGCKDSLLFSIIKNPILLNIDSISYAPIGCTGAAVTDIHVYASTGNGSVIYKWTDKLGIVLGNSSTLSGVGEGDYIITIKDNLCTISDTVTIAAPKAFTYSNTLVPAECGPGESGGTPGSACININGGNLGYSFLWQDGTQGTCISGPAGGYNVTISDKNGCIIKDKIVISGAQPIKVNVLDSIGISCNDGLSSDGSVLLMASGGNNPSNVFNFKIENGNSKFGSIVSFNNLEGGINHITVSYNLLSGNVCSVIDSVYIPIPAKLKLDKTSTKVISPKCKGDCDGSGIVKATGGNNAAYFYHWQETNTDGSIATGLCAGKYKILIKDANGCETIDSVTITEPEKLVVVIDSSKTKDINCNGGNSGAIYVKYSGGNTYGTYTFNWSPNISNTAAATNLAKGVYSVTVSDWKGCNDFVTYEIKEQVPITFSPVQPDQIKCFGDKTCVYVQNVSGGSGGPYSFSINGGGISPVDSCISVYANTVPYLVSVFDNQGCRAEKDIKISQPDQIIVDLGTKLVMELGDSVVVHVNTDAIVDSIIWQIDDKVNDFTFLNPNKSEVQIKSFANNTIYATVVDVNGCTDNGSLDIIVNTLRNVNIPNIFTPNGDGKNDFFEIQVGKGVKQVTSIKIYDRWGELIHEENNVLPSGAYAGNWDGTFKGSKLNPGVYVYMINVEFSDKREILYRGSITLIK